MIALLLACANPAAQRDTAIAQETGLFPAAPALPNQLDAADVEAAITTTMAQDFVLPSEIYTWFHQIFDDVDARDESCPTQDVSDEDPDEWTSYWGGTCTGSRYSVQGGWMLDVIETDDGTTQTLSATELHSFIGQQLATGGAVASGGQLTVSVETSTSDPAVALDMSALGAFSDASTDNALASGVSLGVALTGSYQPGVGFTGTLSGPIAGEEVAIDLRDLVFAEGAAAPTGELRVRDPSTIWWTLTLDDDGAGCGELRYDGASMGTACVGESLTEALNGRLAAWYGASP